MPDDPERGLYGKYRVERVDGKGIGRCIVLELDDPNSWPALLQWAQTVEDRGFGPLADDVRKWVAVEQSIARVDATIVDDGEVAVSSTTDAEASEKRRVMESQWMVKAVTETQDKITATLVRGVWFRENPDYRQMMDEYDALVEQVGIEEADRRSAGAERAWIEEFLDAGPDVEGAIFSEEGETITVDVTKAAFTLHAGDTLSMTLDRLGHEVADGDA